MRRREREERLLLLVRDELGPDQVLFVVWMGEPFSRGEEVFSTAPNGVDLMRAFIKGATHRQYQGGLIELWILN